MAVSAVMPRLPLRMAVIRLAGTRRARARAFADRPASLRMSCSISPGWMGGNFFAVFLGMVFLLLMIIHDLHVEGIFRFPDEAYPVLVVDSDAVLPLSNPFEWL